MNEHERKMLADEIAERLSNGDFKGEILERFDDVEKKIDDHRNYSEHIFDSLTKKANEHEKSLKKIRPLIWYIGLASHKSKITRAFFWVSLLFLFIFFIRRIE